MTQINDPDQMALAAYGHHTLPLPYGDRIIFIGDSAHSTSPQLGQGANMALLDVKALALAMERSATLATALAFHARQRRLHVRLYQLMSCLFMLRDWAAAPAGHGPRARSYRLGRHWPQPGIGSLLSHLARLAKIIYDEAKSIFGSILAAKVFNFDGIDPCAERACL